VTDRETDRQTCCDSTVSAMHMHRAVKTMGHPQNIVEKCPGLGLDVFLCLNRRRCKIMIKHKAHTHACTSAVIEYLQLVANAKCDVLSEP